MAHFVTDYSSYTTKVSGIVGIGIKERRLQNGCREAYFVRCGVVVSIYRLWRHAPLGFIYLLIGATCYHVVGSPACNML